MRQNLIRKIKNVWRGRTQVWGTAGIKRSLWDREYSGGRWDHCDDTRDDFVYRYIEKYCGNGSILDLGCGSGNTGNELEINRYRDYTGVDISAVAIQKAAQRSEHCGRAEKNRYICSDIFSYVPHKQYHLILFRDSIYYVPRSRIRPMLERYSQCLLDSGFFIVRLNDPKRWGDIAEQITRLFRVEENHSTHSGAMLVVFR